MISGPGSNLGFKKGKKGGGGPLPVLLCVIVVVVVVLFLVSSSSMLESAELSRGSEMYERHMQKRGFKGHIASRTGGLGTAIPVLVPASVQAGQLRALLSALRRCDGIDETVVVVSQDGFDADVFEVIEEHMQMQHTKGLATAKKLKREATGGNYSSTGRGSDEKGWRDDQGGAGEAGSNAPLSELHVIHLSHVRPYFGIPGWFRDKDYATAANIKFLLSFAFEQMHAPAAIVLQSDLLPSPDMYRYFQVRRETSPSVNRTNALAAYGC
jgi:hypothetical protein